jgi:hypothetical protein
MTKPRLLLLVWAVLWIVVLASASKAMLDRLPVPADAEGSAQNLQVLRTRDRIPLLLTSIAANRPYLFGDRLLYVALALIYTVVLVFIVVRVAGPAVKDEGP